ncbi:hypothetical protein [Endozoicomonas sp. SCSIO W0465]|uniref:hypothetical protein n=1 Tax=Endozoicomonas sp. SCSIO W0465 TaxID=2918516 RepID=UPI002075E777|nr:hypothetical protein [Endozoicomonas sp. SCSIO W0465]USE34865.1 hypothetical protein MJO57_22450 [Endozoicomonas sp. SCSIO W0465]
MPIPVGVSAAPQVTVVEPHKRDWTIVRWCHKVADSVSRQFDQESTLGKWLGRVVAVAFVPFGILPSLVGDAYHGSKSIYDRCVAKKEAVEKKIPTKAEFDALNAEKEALKAENEALLKRLSAAQADARNAKLENADLINRAERQMDALLRNAHEEQVVFRQHVELEKEALARKAQDAFNKERESKIRCIGRLHNELEAKVAESAAKSSKISALQCALDDHVAKVLALEESRHNLSDGAIQHMHNARHEEARADFLRGELNKELGRPWQDKYVAAALKDIDDSSAVNSVSSFTNSNGQNESSVAYHFNIPGAEPRMARLTPSQVPAFRERLEQLDNERRQLAEDVHRLAKLPALLRSLDAVMNDFDVASEYSSAETDSVMTGSSGVTSESSDDGLSDDDLTYDLFDSRVPFTDSEVTMGHPLPDDITPPNGWTFVEQDDGEAIV